MPAHRTGSSSIAALRAASEAASSTWDSLEVQLHEFIRTNQQRIVSEWEAFARTRTPASTGMTALALRNNIEAMLEDVADDMASPQTRAAQVAKSLGAGPEQASRGADAYAAARVLEGFSLDQVVSEFRALRASVVRLWLARPDRDTRHDVEELTRFHEAIDELLAATVSRYNERFTRYRDTFVGILGHDLRTPLGAITAAATFLGEAEVFKEQHRRVARRILDSAARMERMIADLLDFTRARIGGGIPLSYRSTDLAALCRQQVEELRARYPNREIWFDASGDLRGQWDADRLSQVVSNLVGNALDHSPGEVAVDARDHGDQVSLKVHNRGAIIPDPVLPTLFEPMGPDAGETRVAGRTSSGLGLGLYIAREIVAGHGGQLSATSTPTEGTTFTVRLPRHRRAATAA